MNESNFTVGKQAIPLHTLCGEWWEILLNDVRYCIIVGNRNKAEQVCAQLNRGGK